MGEAEADIMVHHGHSIDKKWNENMIGWKEERTKSEAVEEQ